MTRLWTLKLGPLAIATKNTSQNFAIESPTASEVWVHVWWRFYRRIAKRRPLPIVPFIRSPTPTEHARKLRAVNAAQEVIRHG